MVSDYIKHQRKIALGVASAGFCLLCLILEIFSTPPKKIDLNSFDGVVVKQEIHPGMGRRPPLYNLTLQSGAEVKNFSIENDYLSCLRTQLDLKPGDVVHAKIGNFRYAQIWQLSQNNETFFTYDQMYACVQKHSGLLGVVLKWCVLIFGILSASIFGGMYVSTRRAMGNKSS